MTETAEDVLERFARGDIDAFEALFRDFQGEVYGWIFRIVRDRGAAEDLTVEAFWRIYRARARFDPRRSFGAYLRRVATNLAIDYLGARRPAIPLEDSPAARAGCWPPDSAVAADVRVHVAAAFRELPAKLRAAATLFVLEEEPYAAIAEALGISIGTVKSRVFRALRLLRASLEGAGVRP
jgi:RNA polymerase sigma factor CnrH